MSDRHASDTPATVEQHAQLLDETKSTFAHIGAQLSGAAALLEVGLDDTEVDWRSALALVRQARQDLLVAAPRSLGASGAPPAGAAPGARSGLDAGAAAAPVVPFVRSDDRFGFITDFAAAPVILNPAATLHDILAMAAARAEALHHMAGLLSTCAGAGAAFEPHEVSDVFAGPIEDLFGLVKAAFERARPAAPIGSGDCDE